jgi:hypothetical protein
VAGRLQEQLDRIEAKADASAQQIARNTATLERNTKSLEEHMARTKLLEDRVSPIEKHIAMWAGAGKTVVYVSTVLAAAAALAKILTSIW